MSINRILTIVFGLLAIFLGYKLYDGIYSRIALEQRIKGVEARIISKLKMIREAEKAYLAVNGQFTSDWDQLLNFVDSGYLYIVTKKETIIPKEYGGDEVIVEIDTVGQVPVMDSVFSKKKYPDFDLQSLPYIPEGGGKKFDIWADKIEKGGVLVDLIEVKNTVPVDPRRDEDSEYITQKPLRFGSKESVTTSGNWE